MGVRDRGAPIDRRAERRQLGLDVGMSREEGLQAEILRRRARHVADEMHDRFAALDVGFELHQGVAAERLEILLDFQLDVRPRQRTAQCVAIGAKLVGYAGQEQLDRHRLAPAIRAAQ